jgi:RHS repeat-associated protein
MFFFQNAEADESSLSSSYLGSLEGDPASIVENVSTIYGDYTEIEIDLVVPAPDPIILSRFYSSRDNLQTAMFGGWRFNPHCFLSVHKDEQGKTQIVAGTPQGSIFTYVAWQNPSNSDKRSLFKIDPDGAAQGLANTSSGNISAWTNQKNNALYFDPQANSFELVLCTGGKRFYEKNNQALNLYFLIREVLPSGNMLFYEYDQTGHLSQIKETNASNGKVLGWIKLQYGERISVSTSDGKTVEYHFQQNPSGFRLLTEVVRSHKPTVNYHYLVDDTSALLQKKELPEGRFVEIEYSSKNHENRHLVQSVTTPFSSTQNSTTHFTYRDDLDGGGHTEVTNPMNGKTVYRFDASFQLMSIEQYLSGSLERVLRKSWGSGRDVANLKFSTVEDGLGAIFYCKSFTYDGEGKGNIVEEREYGNLTGSHSNPFVIDENGKSDQECHLKTYAYFTGEKFDGVLQKDPKDAGIKSWYKKGTNQLIKKFVLKDGYPEEGNGYYYTAIKKRFFYEYNDDANLIRITTDNGSSSNEKSLSGVSERHITCIFPKQALPHIGAPEQIEEKCLDPKTATEILLARTKNQFDSQGNIVSQSVYDANGEFRFGTSKTYKDGLVVSEIDRLGNETRYVYDTNQNPVSVKEIATGLTTEYGYDLNNRLISTVERNSEGESFKTNVSFNPAGQKVSEQDRFGNKTYYSNDDLGRPISIVIPTFASRSTSTSGAEYRYAYDLFNNPISITDPSGNLTRKQYTANGKPVSILYSDKTSELFKYDVEGTLHRYRGKNGLVQVYGYNEVGQLDHIEYYKRDCEGVEDGFKRKFFSYLKLQLINEEDELGNITEFTYDDAGRLATKTKGGQKVEFIYDRIGRQQAEKRWNSSTSFTLYITERDPIDRVTEERIENSQGQTLKRTKFAYDQAGRLAQVIGYPQNQETVLIQYQYDGWGRLSKVIDANNHMSQFHYDDKHVDKKGRRALKRTLINPVGNQTEEIFDPSGNLVQITKKDKSGLLLTEEEFFYDFANNKVQEKAAIISAGLSSKFYESTWAVNKGNQLQGVTHGVGTSGEQNTSYQYNSYGEITTKMGRRVDDQLEYDYDARGDLRTLSYEDGTDKFNYQFAYDKKGNLVEVGLANGHSMKYAYDENDLLLLEKITGPLGSYQVSCVYDGEGKIQTLKLPDDSSINYTYDGPFVKAISRVQSGKELYKHQVASRDLMGNVLEEILPGKGGKRKQSWDRAGRRTEISTSFFTDKVPEGGYDPVGNILRSESEFRNEKNVSTYEYNALSQLIAEKGALSHTYAYDSLGNRISQDALAYQVNEANQLLDSGRASNTYDVNGNIATKTVGGKTWIYHFNPLGQLVSIKSPDSSAILFNYDWMGRRLSKRIQTPSKKDQVFRYFYLGATELGCIQENGNILELRIPGDPNQPEVTSFIAIELGKQIFFPAYDLQGNIACVFDHQRSKVIEKYTYSAFGEELIINETGNFISDSSIGNPWRYQSKRKDKETGLIYFGQRYYEPSDGRWISPDPAGNIDGLNLYVFSRNNPMKYADHFGLASEENENQSKAFMDYFFGEVEPRCHCPVDRNCKRGGDIAAAFAGSLYQSQMDLFGSPYFQGSIQALGGLIEASIGGGLTLASSVLPPLALLGFPIMAHGMDQYITGFNTIYEGQARNTVTHLLLVKVGLSPQSAAIVDGSLSIAGCMGGLSVLQYSQTSSNAYFRLRFNTGVDINESSIDAADKTVRLWPSAYQEKQVINGIEYSTHALVRMSPRGLIQSGTQLVSRGIPPSVVENAIKFGTKMPGNTANELIHSFQNIKVVTNIEGTKVITVITMGR